MTFFLSTARIYILGLYAVALMMMSESLASPTHAAASHPSLRSNSTTSGGSCAFTKTEYAVANAFDETTSENFVDLRDGGSITFTQARTGCVAGTFFANAGSGTPGDHMGLQVLLDGSPCPPLTNGYIFADSEFSSHAAAFFCGAHIARGEHTIQVRYHSGFGGNVQFFQRTLEVNHT